jgi:hypothetical protein
VRDAATTYIAVQRLADGQRLVRSPLSDPILPAVDVVAVVGEQVPTQVAVLPLAMSPAQTRRRLSSHWGAWRRE